MEAGLGQLAFWLMLGMIVAAIIVSEALKERDCCADASVLTWRSRDRVRPAFVAPGVFVVQGVGADPKRLIDYSAFKWGLFRRTT